MIATLAFLVVVAAIGAWRRADLRRREAPAAGRMAPRLHEGLPVEARGAVTTSIARALPGTRVALIATVRAPAGLVAPASRRACVAYDLVVHDARTGKQLVRDLRAEVFAVEDATGEAVVDARGAVVRVELDHAIEDLTPAQLVDPAMVRDHAASPLGADEGAIVVGARVLIIGVVQPAEDVPGAAYRRSADVRIRITGGEHAAMISNLPEDLARFE